MSAWKRRLGDCIRSGGLSGVRSARELLVLMVYAEYANAEGRAWPSRATVAEAVGCRPEHVSRAVSRLCALGVIERSHGEQGPEILFLGMPHTAPESATCGTRECHIRHGGVPPVASDSAIYGTPIKEEPPRNLPGTSQEEEAREAETHAEICAALDAWHDTGRASVRDARARIAWVIADDFDRRGPVALAAGGELGAAAFAAAAAAEANRGGVLLATTRQGQGWVAAVLERCRDEGVGPGDYAPRQRPAERRQNGEFADVDMGVT